ncbi:MAG: ImmA/IrrE family metallo-endopeptidase [Candidatus Eisenbacteria bacterium]|uniref:ImmA/IrrE family metallo-endopeptidase n=1 Tax=Eiseniibacteriota bacterium TaxID=2212470 RepID=A0A538TBH2_UNCEI|nr:MAG: ImmA/IrrE family metallo-endopeptidase [Candidatus Eisenbacteria bacterium]
MRSIQHLGKRIRALRLRESLTQTAMAERLGVSTSYLNLIEHDRRPVSANLLIKLAQFTDLDLKSFAPGEDTKLAAILMEVFGDPVFEGNAPSESETREFVASNPEVARAVLHLHHSFVETRGSAATLAAQVLDRQDLTGIDRGGMASEQVTDLIQRYRNHFPELEAQAERLWKDARLEGEDLFGSLARYLESKHRVDVQVLKVGEMGSAVRRFDPERRKLQISEVLRRGSRNFQLAYQIGLLDGSDLIDRIAREPELTSDEARALCRVALANYFSAAVLMPYEEFLRAAQQERYDLDLLQHRFRANYEQVCHRLTSLQKRGAEGVPFYMVRIDIAGNISKKFSAIGLHFPRFGGLCPLWNVHAAFLRPNVIRVQISRLPDGRTFFSIGRTIRKHRGGFHAPEILYAIELGCDIDSARQLVYADGMDLSNPAGVIPAGITCRLCERLDCGARAFPSMHNPLRIDENVRGISFYAPAQEEQP